MFGLCIPFVQVTGVFLNDDLFPHDHQAYCGNPVHRVVGISFQFLAKNICVDFFIFMMEILAQNFHDLFAEGIAAVLDGGSGVKQQAAAGCQTVT